MSHAEQFYIDGRWVEPSSTIGFDVVNPATETPIERLALGNAQDVDRAVAAARRAFPAWC
jgi:aldehyde dehydrogenase (NAD+)